MSVARMYGGAPMTGPMLTPLWGTPPLVAIALIVLQSAAFAFAWWARIHMGRLWSGNIVVREDHRVIDTGPFRLVRHPIYTAFIVASWTLALIGAMPQALAGAVVLTALHRRRRVSLALNPPMRRAAAKKPGKAPWPSADCPPADSARNQSQSLVPIASRSVLESPPGDHAERTIPGP